MMELNNNPKQCENCCHTRVCSLKDKLKAYIEEYDMLNEKYGDFFPKNPSCPEYLSNKAINKHYHEINTPNDKPSDTVDKWVKKVKNNPFVYNGEPIKITYGDNDMGYGCYNQKVREEHCPTADNIRIEEFAKYINDLVRRYRE